MSIVRAVVVECDIPDCDAATEWDARIPDATTAAEARRIARRDGWHRIRHGDICPDCWIDGRRPAPTRSTT
ncbi:hypothetical protein [Embleya sp. NPDC005971]|uniref:hypothetical protein n=1 Tax=Embleya sp. NPDC005971 TaxID=3156724 RepID=UPI003408D041